MRKEGNVSSRRKIDNGLCSGGSQQKRGCFNFTTEGEKEEKVKTKSWERSKVGMDDERTKDPGNACVGVVCVCVVMDGRIMFKKYYGM